MSNKDTGSKWVSKRVLEQKTAPTPGPGGKMMEDGAIASQRIKELHAGGGGGGGGGHATSELPATTSFERQEATDALSNLAHNSESTTFELRGEPVFAPAMTPEEFDVTMLKELATLDK